jgi:NAD(P)-dependent dehydrogenase (short-subunit alcohol dehydrogenase family)
LFSVINPLNRLILVARNEEKAQYAKAQVQLELIKLQSNKSVSENLEKEHDISLGNELSDWTENIIPLVCDQTSFDSVRNFNKSLRHRLLYTYRGHKWALNGIDVLCLNAAILTAKDSHPQYTRDGYEVTFQSNHLSPFLMTTLIQDLINPGGRVVVTTSGLYNWHKLDNMDGLERMVCETRQGDGRLHRNDSVNSMVLISADVQKLQLGSPSPSPMPSDTCDSVSSTSTTSGDMVDGSEFHFKRSYAISKLCNVALCLGLNERLRARNDGSFAVCFSPGLMTSSGLFRYQDSASNSWHDNPDILKKEKSVLWGAGSLVYMSIADEVVKAGGAKYWSDTHSNEASNAIYGKEFVPSAVSSNEITNEQTEKLWSLSLELLQR